MLDDRGNEVLRLVDEGYSIERMAKALNVSYTAVRNYLVKNKIQTKARHSDVTKLTPTILKLAEQGLNNQEISKHTGVNANTIGKLLKDRDLHAAKVQKLNLGIKVIERVDSRSRIYECSEGHRFKRNTNNFLQTPTCPECAPRSKGEDDFYKVLSQFADFKRNVKLEGSNLEYDFYCESKKLAIEYCGEYWHSDQFKDKYYHKNRYELAKASGVTLLQFWEHEVLEQLETVKSTIKSKLGIFSTRYYARKLTLRSVPKEQEKAFFKNNHLQKYTPSIWCDGLYLGDELVCALSIRLVKNDLEIARFATKRNCQVVGGFSRLLKKFVKIARSRKVKLFTYANARYSRGDVYGKAGFKFVKHTVPDFFFLKNGKKLNRRAAWSDESVKSLPKVYGTGNLRFEYED